MEHPGGGDPRELAPAPATPVEPIEAARRRFEQGYLRSLLTETAHNISRAARVAGLTRQGLYRLLRRHGISPRPMPQVAVDEDLGGTA
jgi:transcriptional regulator of acetoin/glycerol metabolism